MVGAVGPVRFRDALSRFATGVTVISTVDGVGNPSGLTVNSFSSLSLNPPLVQWSLATKAYCFRAFYDSQHFAISVLAAGQEEVSRVFTRPVDRFAAVSVAKGSHDLPLVVGAAAWLECEKVHTFPGGDHTIFVGIVKRCETFDRMPLIIWRSQYFEIPPSQVWLGEADVF